MTRIEEERIDEMLAPRDVEEIRVRAARLLDRMGKTLRGPKKKILAERHVDAVNELIRAEGYNAALLELKELRAQGGVRVKGLEWTTPEQNWLKATSPWGTFLVCDQPMFGKSWRSFSPAGWPTHSGYSREEVQQKVEADYRTRILSALETDALEPVAWLGVACSDPHSVPIKQVQAEMREAALQIAADANGGYIGRKVVQIVNAAISSIFAENRADPKTGAPIKMRGDSQ